MGVPFSGPVPQAQIEQLLSFLEGTAPVSMTDLYHDVLAVIGWVSGQAANASLLHLFSFHAAASADKELIVSELKKVLAGNVAAVNWLALLQALLAFIPSLLPLINPLAGKVTSA